MGNIFSDIVEDVQVRPSHAKLFLKWVVRISIILIVAAFTYGQLKSTRLNRLDNIENEVVMNTGAVEDLRDKMDDGFDAVNNRIDKVYVDGFSAFSNFQEYNRKQLGLIIDYSGSNKEMLKRMLEITTIDETKKVENQLEQAKNTKPDSLSIKVTPIKK